MCPCLQHAEYRKQNSRGHRDNEKKIRNSRLYHESARLRVKRVDMKYLTINNYNPALVG